MVKVNRSGLKEFNFVPNVKSSLGSGSTFPFWHVVWRDRATLSTLFPDLYQVSSYKDVLVEGMDK